MRTRIFTALVTAALLTAGAAVAPSPPPSSLLTRMLAVPLTSERSRSTSSTSPEFLYSCADWIASSNALTTFVPSAAEQK